MPPTLLRFWSRWSFPDYRAGSYRILAVYPRGMIRQSDTDSCRACVALLGNLRAAIEDEHLRNQLNIPMGFLMTS
jgi:hypothetical protein